MYYYKSEKEAAFHALKMLESKLPAIPKSAVESPEWGTKQFSRSWPACSRAPYRRHRGRRTAVRSLHNRRPSDYTSTFDAVRVRERASGELFRADAVSVRF